MNIKTDPASSDKPSVMDEAYKNASCSLPHGIRVAISGYRRTITSSEWSGIAKAGTAMLDELINNIQFYAGDFTRCINDNVKLIAETRRTRQ